MKETLGQFPIRMEKFEPEVELEQLAKLYADVFAGPPWSEYTCCPDCSEFFGIQTKPGDRCLNCGGELSLAYPVEQTKEYILRENRKANSVCILAKRGCRIVGFAWGYTYQYLEDFVEQKYRTEKMRFEIKNLLEQNRINGSFFYFSECGVRQDERQKGISNFLSGDLILKAKALNLPVVLRTNCESPMMAVAERYKMTQIMGPVVEINRGAKIIKKTSKLVDDFRDLEIEERVLFVLQ